MMRCFMKKAIKWFLGGCSFLFFILLLFFGCAKIIPLDLTSKKEKITLYDMNQEVREFNTLSN